MSRNAYNIAFKRIKKDLEDINNEDGATCGFSIDVVNDSLLDLKAYISGPSETPYEGGRFILDIKVPQDYPMHPLKVKFVTKIWHPNISSVTGAICLDVLSNNWKATMSVRTVLLSIQALLCAPEPGDPQDAVVAKQYMENQICFRKTAMHWTQVYAGAPGCVLEFVYKIKTLKDMGIDEETARVALSSCFLNLEQAVTTIFS